MIVIKTILMLLAYQQFTVEVAPQFTVEVQSTAQGEDGYYVAVFTSETCSPCRGYKNSGKMKRLIEALPGTVEVNTTVTKTWNVEVERVPTFWLIRKRDRVAVKKWAAGVVELETILKELEKHKGRKTEPPISLRSPIEKAAEDHLRYSHSIVVSGLSMAEMEVLHDNAHGGKQYHFPGTPSYGTTYRSSRFLFWRW